MACSEDFSSVLTKYDQSSVLEMVDKMDRDLAILREQLINLNVRSSLLEVDLATVFDPEEVLQLQRLDASCRSCIQAVQEFSDYANNVAVENNLEIAGSKDMTTDNTEQIYTEHARVVSVNDL